MANSSQIDNDLVRNQFIINQGFEQTVLMENSEEGARFMAERGPLSHNVKMCFTFSNGNKRRGRVINYTGSGGINNSPIDEYRGQLRMQVDKDDQIRYGHCLRSGEFADQYPDKKKKSSSALLTQPERPCKSLRDFWNKLTSAKLMKPITHVARNSSSTRFRKLKNVWRSSRRI